MGCLEQAVPLTAAFLLMTFKLLIETGSGTRFSTRGESFLGRVLIGG
jgi:hypothetical protein